MAQASDDAAGRASEIAKGKIRSLEHRLRIITAERNDLQADVERLCTESSGHSFSDSSVLGQRICKLQKEANGLQSQFDAITAECNTLREDRERLEKELASSQSHSAQADCQRDKAVEEVEELKGLLLKNEDDMEAARVEAERRRHQVELDKSSLQDELREVREKLERSEEERRSVSVVAAADAATSRELIERLKTENICLKADVTQLQRKRAELEDRANEAEGGLVAAQAGMEASGKRLEAELATVRSETRRTVEEAQLQHSREVRVARSEIEKIEKENKALKAVQNKATQDLSSVQLRIAEARDQAAQPFQDVGNMIAGVQGRLTKDLPHSASDIQQLQREDDREQIDMRKPMHVETALAGDSAMLEAKPGASLPRPTSSSGHISKRDLPLPASNKQQQQQQQRDNCKKMPMDLMWELTDKLRDMDESSRNDALQVVKDCQSIDTFADSECVDVGAMEPATLWKLYDYTCRTVQTCVT